MRRNYETGREVEWKPREGLGWDGESGCTG